MEANGCFTTVSQGRIQTLDGSCRTGAFHLMPLTEDYTACSVNPTPNLGGYGATLKALLPPSSAGRTTCSVKRALLPTCPTVLHQLFHVNTSVLYSCFILFI